MAFTGKDLIESGFTPGPYFAAMLTEANESGLIDKAAGHYILEKAEVRW